MTDEVPLPISVSKLNIEPVPMVVPEDTWARDRKWHALTVVSMLVMLGVALAAIINL